MKHFIKLAILVLISFSFLLGFVPVSEAEWENTSVVPGQYVVGGGSPNLFKLQDGRTMLTFTKKQYGSRYLYYLVSTDGTWSEAIRMGATYGGCDATVTQDPYTGEIIVAYSKYDSAAPPDNWHASIYITRINPQNLAYYLDYYAGCGDIYPTDPYNDYWSYPQLVVTSGREALDNNYGLADDIVPSVFFETSAYNKLLIVYAHGWEGVKYGSHMQTARLNIVESTNLGYTWGLPRLAYNSPEINYYDSKPSCTAFAYNQILCSFFKRDRSTSVEGIDEYGHRIITNIGDMGIYTIRSYDLGASWALSTVLPISSYQHFWPFLLKDGPQMLLAYTTKENSPEGDFIIKWRSSVDGGYYWMDKGILSAQSGLAESWPGLARRFERPDDQAYSNSNYGVSAVWNNYCNEFNSCNGIFYQSNLRDFQVANPRPGDIWYFGELRTIEWNTSFASSRVGLELSRDNGLTWENMHPTSIPNSGSYQWTVTAPVCSQCQIRVSDGTRSHISSNFSIYEYYIG